VLNTSSVPITHADCYNWSAAGLQYCSYITTFCQFLTTTAAERTHEILELILFKMVKILKYIQMLKIIIYIFNDEKPQNFLIYSSQFSRCCTQTDNLFFSMLTVLVNNQLMMTCMFTLYFSQIHRISHSLTQKSQLPTGVTVSVSNKLTIAL